MVHLMLFAKSHRIPGMGRMFLACSALAMAVSAQVSVQSANQHLERGEVAEAIRDCKTLLAADPESAAAHLALGQAYLALRRVNMVAEAKAELQQALEISPSMVWARFYLARIYIDLGRYDRAQEELEQAQHTQPGIPHFLALLGEVNRRLGRPAAAVELSRKALAADPSLTPARYYQALALADLHQDQEATRELEGALESKFVSPEMYVALSGLYVKQARAREAVGLCKKALVLDAARPESYVALAQAYNAVGDRDQALEAVRMALPERQALPATPYYQRLQADAYLEYGRAYQAKRKSKDARDAYERVLQLDPDNAAAKQALAELKR